MDYGEVNVYSTQTASDTLNKIGLRRFCPERRELNLVGISLSQERTGGLLSFLPSLLLFACFDIIMSSPASTISSSRKAMVLLLWMIIPGAVLGKHQSAIDNVEECLDCTEAGCLYCESEHQFTPYGQHFSMCNCNEEVMDEDYKSKPGFCGNVFSQFNRYARTERLCINLNEQDEQQKQEEPNNGDAAMIAILAAMIPIVCCLGFCCGCTAVYYVYILKREEEEERRVRERTALMKVVTARQLHSNNDSSISTVDEEEEEDEEDRRVIT